MGEAVRALGINLPTLIAFIVTFVLLLWLLNGFLYKPIMKAKDERAKRIEEGLQKAEQVKKDAERMEAEFKRQLEEARREGQTMVAQATQVAERLRAEAREEAKREAEALLVKARQEIQHERDEAVEQVRRQFAELTVKAAGKVIERSLDPAAHRDLIDKVLEESGTVRKG